MIFARRILPAILAAFALPAAADKLNPEAVPSSMRAWLTPAADALKTPAGPAAPAATPKDGEVLVFERLLLLEDDLSLAEVEHYMARALTEAGADAIRQDTQSYFQLNQTLELAWGRVYAPEGGIKEAKAEEVIEITPSFDAEEAQYSDLAQLRVLLPDVKPGMVVETCWVKRQTRPRLPETLGFMAPWISVNFSTARMRFGVESSPAMAARWKESHLNAAPRRVETVLPDGRVRREWSMTNLAPSTYEDDEPPLQQTGPCSYFTTLADWDHFARVYARVLADLPPPGESIREGARAMAPPEANREELVRAAVAKVANDIRYTGLEFGIAALRPHDANDVWRRGFGDCKDKSNLVRLLLRERGVPAWLVLLQTDTPGEVPREVASHVVFDHAIVAVDDGKGGLIFADPTQKFLPAGRLPEWCGNRPVLLLEDGKARWTRTPRGEPAKLRWDLDLTLESDASLSGWLEKKCLDASAAQQHAWMSALSASDLREAHSTGARILFPDATLVDFEPPVFDATNLVHRSRLFLSRPAQTAADGDRYLLPLPAFLPLEIGDMPERRKPFCLYGGEYQFAARIKIGDAWKPESLPRPFHLDLPELKAHGEVTEADGVVTMAGSMSPKSMVLAPARFAAVHEANDSFQHWLNQPLVLLRAAGAGETVTGGVTRVEMPRMQTGSGQIEYIETRWPESGNLAKRRAALETVRQWFPKDPEALLQVEVLLGGLELREGNPDAAEKRMRALLQGDSGRAHSAENTAWARYVLGLALDRQDKDPEALETFKAISDLPEVSAYRRAFALYKQAELRAPADAAAAAGQYREAALLDSGAQPDLTCDWIVFLAEHGMTNEVRAAAADFASMPEWILPETLSRLDEQVKGRGQAVRRMLVEVFTPPEALANPELTTTWNQHLVTWRAPLDQFGGLERLQAKLVDLVQRTELPGKEKLWLHGKTLPSREEILARVRSAGESSARQPLWSALNAALLYPPDDHTTEMMNTAIQTGAGITAADFPEIPPFIDRVLEIAGGEPDLPAALVVYVSGLRQDRMHAAGRMPEATAMTRRLLETFKGEGLFRTILRIQLCQALLMEGLTEEALEEVDTLPMDELAQVDGCARIALQLLVANVHLRRFGEARHWVRQAAALAEGDVLFAGDEDTRREFIAEMRMMLAPGDKGLETFWKAHPKLLASWQEFAGANGVSPPASYIPGNLLMLDMQALIPAMAKDSRAQLDARNTMMHSTPLLAPLAVPSMLAGIWRLEDSDPPLDRPDLLTTLSAGLLEASRDYSANFQPMVQALQSLLIRDAAGFTTQLPKLADQLSKAAPSAPEIEPLVTTLMAAVIRMPELAEPIFKEMKGVDPAAWPPRCRGIMSVVNAMAAQKTPLTGAKPNLLQTMRNAEQRKKISRTAKEWLKKHPYPWAVFEAQALKNKAGNRPGARMHTSPAGYLDGLRILTRDADNRMDLDTQVRLMASAVARFAATRTRQAELDAYLDSWSDPAAPLPDEVVNEAALDLLESCAITGRRDALLALARRAEHIPDKAIRESVTSTARWYENGARPDAGTIGRLLDPPLARTRIAMAVLQLVELHRLGDYAAFYEHLARLGMIQEPLFLKPQALSVSARLAREDESRVQLFREIATRHLGALNGEKPAWAEERGLLDSADMRLIDSHRMRAEFCWWLLGSHRSFLYEPELLFEAASCLQKGAPPEEWRTRIQTAMENSSSTMIRWDTYMKSLQWLDFDEPATSEIIPAWLAMGAPIATNKAERAYLDFIKAMVEARKGREVQLPAEGPIDPFTASAAIARHMADNHPERTTPILTRLKQKDMLQAPHAAAIMEALRFEAGPHDRSMIEQEWMSELAEQAFLLILQPDGGKFWKCSSLVEALAPSGLLPPDWLDALLKVDRSVEPAGGPMTLEILLHRQEWEALARTAGEQLRLSPAHYELHFHLASALIALGREKEALPHLKTFTEVCKDSYRVPRALREMERIQKAIEP